MQFQRAIPEGPPEFDSWTRFSALFEGASLGFMRVSGGFSENPCGGTSAGMEVF
jgi:hypothetical protein